jgi:hypothetical protein
MINHKKHQSEYPDNLAEIRSIGHFHCSFIHCKSIPNFSIHQSMTLHSLSLRDRESSINVTLHNVSLFSRLLVPTKFSCSFFIFSFSHPQSLLFSFLYINFNLQLSRYSYGLRAGREFPLSHSVQDAVRTTQPPLQWAPGAPSSWLKRPGR